MYFVAIPGANAQLRLAHWKKGSVSLTFVFTSPTFKRVALTVLEGQGEAGVVGAAPTSLTTPGCSSTTFRSLPMSQRLIFFLQFVHISVLVLFCLFLLLCNLEFHLSVIKRHLQRFQRLTQEGSILSLRLFPNPMFFFFLWNKLLCNCLIYCMLLFVNVNHFAVILEEKCQPIEIQSVILLLRFVQLQFALSWCVDPVQQQSSPEWTFHCVLSFYLRRDLVHWCACFS